MREYSNKELEKISKQVKEWCNDFSKTKYFDKLTAEQKKDARFIIDVFAHYLYSYNLVLPYEWGSADVEECCLDLLPRKVADGEAFFKCVSPVLSAFFEFAGDRGLLKNTSKLIETVRKISEEIVENANNPEYWGMAKSIMMPALEAGVNIEDEEELNKFLNRKK